MQWSRGFAVLVLGLACTVGCNKPKPEMEVENTTNEPLTEPDVFTTDTGTGTDIYGTETTGTGYGTMPPATTGGRTHVVQKGDTLYKLARQYYNDQSRWKDIYSANANQLTDPNKLKVGQTLVIP